MIIQSHSHILCVQSNVLALYFEFNIQQSCQFPQIIVVCKHISNQLFNEIKKKNETTAGLKKKRATRTVVFLIQPISPINGSKNGNNTYEGVLNFFTNMTNHTQKRLSFVRFSSQCIRTYTHTIEWMDSKRERNIIAIKKMLCAYMYGYSILICKCDMCVMAHRRLVIYRTAHMIIFGSFFVVPMLRRCWAQKNHSIFLCAWVPEPQRMKGVDEIVKTSFHSQYRI